METKAKRHFSCPARFAMLLPIKIGLPTRREEEKVHGFRSL